MSGTTIVPGSRPTTKTGFARLWYTLRQLFHEVMGGFFAVLALVWLQSAIRAWTHDVARSLVAAAFGVAMLLGVFAWGSFRRARRIQ
jgi:uncharacterized YccA/Bax inhibitor family protein